VFTQNKIDTLFAPLPRLVELLFTWNRIEIYIVSLRCTGHDCS
jgi:hypothetical protein